MNLSYANMLVSEGYTILNRNIISRFNRNIKIGIIDEDGIELHYDAKNLESLRETLQLRKAIYSSKIPVRDKPSLNIIDQNLKRIAHEVGKLSGIVDDILLTESLETERIKKQKAFQAQET